MSGECSSVQNEEESVGMFHQLDTSDKPQTLKKKKTKRNSEERLRSHKFTTEENETLIDGVLRNYDKLFGRPGGLNYSVECKEAIWRDIAKNVSSLGTCIRTAIVCRKRYHDCKSTVKKKMAEEKNYVSGTGGGPAKIFDYLHWEQRLQGIIKLASVVGVPGGLDTGKNTTISDQIQMAYSKEGNGGISKKTKNKEKASNCQGSSKNCLPEVQQATKVNPPQMTMDLIELQTSIPTLETVPATNSSEIVILGDEPLEREYCTLENVMNMEEGAYSDCFYVSENSPISEPFNENAEQSNQSTIFGGETSKEHGQINNPTHIDLASNPLFQHMNNMFLTSMSDFKEVLHGEIGHVVEGLDNIKSTLCTLIGIQEQNALQINTSLSSIANSLKKLLELKIKEPEEGFYQENSIATGSSKPALLKKRKRLTQNLSEEDHEQACNSPEEHAPRAKNRKKILKLRQRRLFL
ncbi:uncharacterized protein LOC134956792 [Pseudophryne corroboree]|uniref:uncharacterized protein LOC134956792 n=1 Tax=Pseudophryne corroboree TaxID=495146 RepID=UPI003082189A